MRGTTRASQRVRFTAPCRPQLEAELRNEKEAAATAERDAAADRAGEHLQAESEGEARRLRPPYAHTHAMQFSLAHIFAPCAPFSLGRRRVSDCLDVQTPPWRQRWVRCAQVCLCA